MQQDIFQKDTFQTILCYGDSNTYGYNPVDGMRYPERVRWPRLMAGMLGDAYRVIEEGCNGRTASVTPVDEPWKDGRIGLEACLNSHKPIDLVIFMLGSNDLKTQFQATPESIAKAMGSVLQKTLEFLAEKQGYSPQVLLVAPPHVGDGIESSAFADRFDGTAAGKSRQLAALYEAEAKAAGCEFWDSSQVAKASEIDSLHLMPEAHEAFAKAIAEKAKAILRR